MNVGVYFPGFPQQAGGAYTFEQDILTSLEAIAGESHHKFTFFFGNNSQFSEESINAEPGKIKRIFLERMPVEETKVAVEKLTGLALLKKAIKNRINNVHDNSVKPIIENKKIVGGLLKKACEMENIEFLWFSTPNSRAADISYVESAWDIPYIATIWDIQHRLQPWFPEVSHLGTWDYRESYYSTYLRRATYIILPNQAGANEISFFYQIPPERIRKLPHPAPKIATDLSNEEVELVMRKYGVTKGFLFYPAQFWAHKNHVNLLLALQFLRDKFNLPFHLVLTGTNQGNMEHIRELTGCLNLNDQVHFLGFVPREDLIALYRGAFALTYMSLFGPENMPPLEAFAYGCPVIASNVDGAQEQIGNAAMLVNGTRSDEIALAIKELYENRYLRDSLIQKGFSRKGFTGADFIKEVFKMLDEFESIRRNWN